MQVHTILENVPHVYYMCDMCGVFGALQLATEV